MGRVSGGGANFYIFVKYILKKVIIICYRVIYVMDNETIAVIIIFGTPLALMIAGSIWWAWKDKDTLD